jgi:hypothetical protein
MTFRSDRTPTEVLTDTLRGCVDGYVGAPALAVQCVSALRAAGWIVVRDDAIRLAQAHARADIREAA